MFTGIIIACGRVKAREVQGGNLRLEIQVPPEWTEPLGRGDSIALDGVCLTVIARAGDHFVVEAVEETLQRTTLGTWTVGRRVNLEPALRAGQALGGHWVQGHVDGTTVLTDVVDRPGSRLHVYALPEAWQPYVVSKGSIAVNGVSLTVVDVAPTAFSVSLIPYTLEHTNLGDLQVGDAVNVELDILAKYIYALVKPYLKRWPGGL
ncbi:MAG: riboflavin synthase [Acidobacteria bacterium]|nr:riboflavin synthase [Acidobacteriota bacterium]MDW7985134.1 riboflavin synthase [Acidobacteriota bacterium]